MFLRIYQKKLLVLRVCLQSFLSWQKPLHTWPHTFSVDRSNKFYTPSNVNTFWYCFRRMYNWCTIYQTCSSFLPKSSASFQHCISLLNVDRRSFTHSAIYFLRMWLLLIFIPSNFLLTWNILPKFFANFQHCISSLMLIEGIYFTDLQV